MPGSIVIVDYDPSWPTLYEKEKDQILETVGHKILAIEHIGSTAVPGLGAKPTIDIMAGVHEKADADECLLPLKKIGYTHVTPEPDNSEWFYCLGKGHHSIGYHLHLVKFPSYHWNRQLAFRDYLRNHSDVAEEYYRLKIGLSEEYRSNRDSYTEAKTAFIEKVILLARVKTEIFHL